MRWCRNWEYGVAIRYPREVANDEFKSVAVRLAGATVVPSLVLGVTPSVAPWRYSSASSAKGTVLAYHRDFHRSPTLTLGSGKATTLTLYATLRGCTGSSAASKVTGGALLGKSLDTSASCVGFENSFPPFTGKVTFKTTSGSIAPTTLAFKVRNARGHGYPARDHVPEEWRNGHGEGLVCGEEPPS